MTAYRTTIVAATLTVMVSTAASAQLFGNQPTLPPWHDPSAIQPGLIFGSRPEVGPAPITQADVTPSRTATVTRLPDGSARVDGAGASWPWGRGGDRASR